MTPHIHPPHHIHVSRRLVRRSIAVIAAVLAIVGTPLVAQALDDDTVAEPERRLAQPAALPTAAVADLGATIESPASVAPPALAARVDDPAIAVLPTPASQTPVLPAGTSAEQWAALRACESGGEYSITNPSGKYRGAYQFDRPTWNSVAERHAPHLVGVDPAAASPTDQDAMAWALYSERGASPWPHCGRHLS